MNRKQWIAAAALLVLLVILCVSGSLFALNSRKGGRGSIGHREPLPGFGYCSPSQSKPCILSVDSNPDGSMMIHLLADGSSPDFYIKIRHEQSEQVYPCEQARKYSINVACTGEAMPIGETLDFLLLSIEGNNTLAEGRFPILGMALATPEVRITATPVSTFHHPPK